MVMLTDILKERGIFAKEIKARFAQKQIKVNGLVVEEDFDIGEIETSIEIGDFIFSLMRNNIWALRIRLFGLEELMTASNIKNDLTEFLKGFLIVRTSRKDVFVIKRKHKQM